MLKRTVPEIMALTLNYACAAGKVLTSALAGHLVLNVDASFFVGINSGACEQLSEIIRGASSLLLTLG